MCWGRAPLMRAVGVYLFFRMSPTIVLRSCISGAESRLQGFRFDARNEGSHFVPSENKGIRMTAEHHGGCLCTQVRFRVKGEPSAVVGCHCSQCRRQTGFYFTGADVALSDLTIEGGDIVHWYRSSEEAQRGFCSNCGSVLFWQGEGSSKISILAGAFDEPNSLSFGYHIYCADKAGFYEINDGLPQYPKGLTT
jgi:hypothetical protein